MSKRILAMLLALVMVLSVMTACTSGSDDSEKTPTSGNQTQDDNKGNEAEPGVEVIGNFAVPSVGYDGSDVTITFYHTMGQNIRSVLDNYIVEFNELYPNIHIEHTQIGAYDDVRDQIQTELFVGGQPNMAYCYPDHIALYDLAEAVTILDDLIESDILVTRADGTTETLGLTDEQKADFYEVYYNEGKVFDDGMMYMMPLTRSTEVLFYNKTFFEQHNLTVPTTWAEMEALCAQIKAIDPESIPLGYDSTDNWFITMCEQYGSGYTSAEGDHFLFNNEQNRSFVKMFNQWYDNGYMTTKTLCGTYTSELFTAETGTKSYMSIGSTGGATHQIPTMVNNAYPFEVGIAPIPQVDPANPKVISQGPSLCIFQKENPQEVVATWLFVKFLTTNQAFQAEMSMATGYMTVIKSAAENPIYADYLASADGGAFLAALAIKTGFETADASFTSPAFNGSSVARDQVGALLNKCLTMSGDDLDAQIEEAFEDAVVECEYFLE